MITSSSTASAAGVVGDAVVAWSFRLEMELATGRKFTGLIIRSRTHNYERNEKWED